jgi:hypothetical protein
MHKSVSYKLETCRQGFTKYHSIFPGHYLMCRLNHEKEFILSVIKSKQEIEFSGGRKHRRLLRGKQANTKL